MFWLWKTVYNELFSFKSCDLAKISPQFAEIWGKEWMYWQKDPQSFMKGKEVSHWPLLPNVRITKPCYGGLCVWGPQTKVQWRERTQSFPQGKLSTGESGLRQWWKSTTWHTVSLGSGGPQLEARNPRAWQPTTESWNVPWCLQGHRRVLSKAMPWFLY